MKRKPIFVQIKIQSRLEELWARTQNPADHARWDLRFSDIEYRPRPDNSAPQAFNYATRIGFGATVRGVGATVGTADRNGALTSALAFRSDDPRSLIENGSGYWKYILQSDTIIFLTHYDYKTRFGTAGRIVDRFLFRPLLGWATAWSFDCLRLWLEENQTPETSFRLTFFHGLARISLALIWVYQGLVPKLIFPDTGEQEILANLPLFSGLEALILKTVGLAEIALGLSFLAAWRVRGLFVLNLALLPSLMCGALIAQPSIFAAPFNPISLTISMIALNLIGYQASVGLPTAASCLRKPAE